MPEVSVHILFVCRGNTCRSVLAHYIAQSLEKSLPIKGRPIFRSAGVQAWSGQSASQHAVDILERNYRLDIRPHRSWQLDERLIAWADKIYTMTPERRLQITHRFPSAAPKLELLSDRLSLQDPIGGDYDEYEVLSRQIEDALKQRFAELGFL